MASASRCRTNGYHRRQRGSLNVGAFVVAVAGLLATLVVVGCLLIIGRPDRLISQPDGGSAESHLISSRPPTTYATTAARPGPRTPRPVAGQWLRVLQALDERRRSAWRLGEPRLLNGVYAHGSAVLRADRTMLRGYVERGLRVSGVSLHFSSVLVDSRSPESVTVLVVDRLLPAVAVDAENHRRALPRDRPTQHRIELQRRGHAWRIAAVTLG